MVLISLALVPFSNRCGTSPPNPPPFGASIFTGTRSFLQSMWDPPNPPLLGSSVLIDTLSHIYPLWGTTFSLEHSPVSDSDTICNDPDPPLANIVLFRLFPSSFPLRLLKRVCWGERFPHPYK